MQHFCFYGRCSFVAPSGVLLDLDRITADAKTVTNVVASADSWKLGTDVGCGPAGCLPDLATVSACIALRVCVMAFGVSCPSVLVLWPGGTRRPHTRVRNRFTAA